MSVGGTTPTGGDFKPILDVPGDTPAVTPVHVITDIFVETANISAVPGTPSPLFGRVSGPTASMNESGILTVTHEGRAYSYDPSGEKFASGHVNEIFNDLSPTVKPEPYVLTLPKSKSSQSLEIQKATLEYQKELYNEGPIDNVEPPGHIVTYTDPRTGEVKTALWSKQYNRRDLDYFMRKYPDEFGKLSPDAIVGMGMQVIKGMTNLALKRSTYLDAKPENIGVEVKPDGEVQLYIRDFDKVSRIPTATELENESTQNAFIIYLDQFPDMNFTPALMPLNEFKALVKLSQQIKVNLQIEEDITELLEQFVTGIEKIQAFQTGSILYAMIHPKSKVPLELAKDHTEENVQFTLAINLANLGLKTDEVYDEILGLIDLNPQHRHTLTE